MKSRGVIAAMKTFDLCTPEFANDPYPLYHEMLAEAPIHWNEALGGWYVCRYDDVVAGLRDPRLSNERFARMFAQLPDELQRKLHHFIKVTSGWTVSMDPPAHTRLRGLTSDGFTPRSIEGFRHRIAATVERVLSEHRGAGRMDVAADLSGILPLAVIVELFGAPMDYIEKFQKWFDPMAAMFKTPNFSDEQLSRLNDAAISMSNYLQCVVEERRREPQNDIISHLTRVTKDDQSLTDEEIVQECILLLPAGHETTKLVLTHAVLTFLEHPQTLEEVRRDPTLLPGAVEEILRLQPALHKLGRLALSDLEICGQPIAAGDLVWFGLATANRDPRAFPDPDRFDIHRKNNKHLAFGYGIHYCEGAGLARLELQMALRALLELKDLKLGVSREELTWVDGNHSRELVSLPVIFDAMSGNA
jgi:hypothetical protein